MGAARPQTIDAFGDSTQRLPQNDLGGLHRAFAFSAHPSEQRPKMHQSRPLVSCRTTQTPYPRPPAFIAGAVPAPIVVGVGAKFPRPPSPRVMSPPHLASSYPLFIHPAASA